MISIWKAQTWVMSHEMFSQQHERNGSCFDKYCLSCTHRNRAEKYQKDLIFSLCHPALQKMAFRFKKSLILLVSRTRKTSLRFLTADSLKYHPCDPNIGYVTSVYLFWMTSNELRLIGRLPAEGNIICGARRTTMCQELRAVDILNCSAIFVRKLAC